MLHKISVPDYRTILPSIIRETLGDETADQMQKVIDEAPPRDEYIIWGNDKFEKAFREAVIKDFGPFKN